MPETFFVEYQDINISRPYNPERSTRLHISATDLSDAAKKAHWILIKTAYNMRVYNATIIRMRNGERYEILREGAWLIDTETGRKLETKVQ